MSLNVFNSRVTYLKKLLLSRNDNSSLPFCNCEYPAVTRSRHTARKVERCRCGEDTSTQLDWIWEDEGERPERKIINGTEILFHLVYSQGTAVVRGTEPLEPGMHHYWEIKVLSSLAGTDIMLGIGTEKVDLQANLFKFASVLGLDDQSWGYSYRGLTQHNSQLKHYGKKFSQGRIIGIYVDMYRGILEFYLNRRSQGRAYVNIPHDGNTRIYPMVCSTSAKSSLKLINASSFADSLVFSCMKVICKYPKLLEQVNMVPGLRKLADELWFLQFKEPKKTDEFQRNNLLLEDEALLCGLKKKKLNEALSHVEDISEEKIYENMIAEENTKTHNVSTGSSSSSSDDEELASMISREFFCNH
ncbi:SPRY domain-containing SOCS box protein 3 [Wyeomyia smithii]|uniref:SPRY domain-containing SOCS box protein 3 n=1 Tax=Wyeomyia smithii TaxID=174621 RepID=UPI002467BF99|nr:SPRY domain-containing SOCS box protein 3 [Wyeomyia smithii]XP_055537546.1 SPRY domain-containing SOCS box protein 3 [Wyeomyia smithii]XP_055537547.1 SPRY domain-containing SOCS box protein 3 [Wyeomyia smithii]XP_055537548.1 SPRY domain-containing SOCS box protein 3 [Wyeomyia smithii]XP_055537549.1 SPRY domain-containing SOCS box protein 3 [Wyeomyia smithii]XP_055537550.1 SPRY domain-containing SOCS box protein 3 [Wyeomyia smithii]XP_055537551.1 SPRY domain-containing SOCS box protein 3 [W